VWKTGSWIVQATYVQSLIGSDDDSVFSSQKRVGTMDSHLLRGVPAEYCSDLALSRYSPPRRRLPEQKPR